MTIGSVSPAVSVMLLCLECLGDRWLFLVLLSCVFKANITFTADMGIVVLYWTVDNLKQNQKMSPCVGRRGMYEYFIHVDTCFIWLNRGSKAINILRQRTWIWPTGSLFLKTHNVIPQWFYPIEQFLILSLLKAMLASIAFKSCPCFIELAQLTDWTHLCEEVHLSQEITEHGVNVIHLIKATMED